MELRIRGLSTTYPNGVRALKHVTLTIPVGVYGLLGPPGAGKSTLIRILATLEEPDSGTVHLGELDFATDRDEVRARLGYLPEAFGADADQSLFEHSVLLKAAPERCAPREVVDALLLQVDRWQARRQQPCGGSAGRRPRLGMAMTLLGNPRLMLLDEPTAGLDPAERRECLNLLGELGKNSVVLFSTHCIEDVSEVCTRMAIIADGRILLETEPRRAAAAAAALHLRPLEHV